MYTRKGSTGSQTIPKTLSSNKILGLVINICWILLAMLENISKILQRLKSKELKRVHLRIYLLPHVILASFRRVMRFNIQSRTVRAVVENFAGQLLQNSAEWYVMTIRSCISNRKQFLMHFCLKCIKNLFQHSCTERNIILKDQDESFCSYCSS